MVNTNKLRVLVFDVETAPLIAYVWDRRDQNIAINQLKSDWYILAWAAKWLDDPESKVMYMDQRKAQDMENDKDILVPLWKLLDEADIVITQNGKNFDSRKLNARFIMHGMTPPSKYDHLDTYQIVRRVASFTSNSLEYLTDKLCTKYKKLSHAKFPGMSLWKECLGGNKAAWDEMKKYNIHDVLSTEEFYKKIRAWAPQSSPDVFKIIDPASECGTCGIKGQMIHRGYAYTKTTKKARFQCKGCGSWQQKAEKAKTLKKAA